MGVAGAGLATVGANATSAVQILYFLTHEELPIRLSFKSLTIDRDAVSKILKIGVPAGLREWCSLLPMSVSSLGSTVLELAGSRVLLWN